MRCFVAIDLPENIKAYLSKIQGSLPEADMKIVEKNNLHLTLAFIGEISDFKVDRCKALLNEITSNRFNASLGNLGFFPSQNLIRVIWVSLEPSDIVKGLYSQIYDSLKEEFNLDNRFESHITLARVKYIQNKEQFMSKLFSLKTEKKEFEVNSFALKKSTLTSEGPAYNNIAAFNLKG